MRKEGGRFTDGKGLWNSQYFLRSLSHAQYEIFQIENEMTTKAPQPEPEPKPTESPLQMMNLTTGTYFFDKKKVCIQINYATFKLK